MKKIRWKLIAIPFALITLVVFLNFSYSGDDHSQSSSNHSEQITEQTSETENVHQNATEHQSTEFAVHHNEGAHPEAVHEEPAKFDPGSFIIDHIVDNYSWHILTWKGKHVSIPLPVILISKAHGLTIFLSNKFHHGHSAYKGFEIAQDGEHKGQIVEVSASGEILDVPFDLSITKIVFALLISVAFILILFLTIANAYKRNPNKAPKGIQNLIEPIIIFIRDDVAKASIGEKKYQKYTPFLLSVFFFIFFNNIIGLIPIFPGGANLTGNISITMVLALFTFVITTFSGNKNYWLHIFNAPGVPWWLKLPIPLIPIIELMGTIIKPFVLMVRLFANITAGHIIALGFFSLIFIFGEMNQYLGLGVSVLSVAFAVFMFVLELLVAFIQAYVFTLLSAIYFGMAVEEHH